MACQGSESQSVTVGDDVLIVSSVHFLLRRHLLSQREKLQEAGSPKSRASLTCFGFACLCFDRTGL